MSSDHHAQAKHRGHSGKRKTIFGDGEQAGLSRNAQKRFKKESFKKKRNPGLFYVITDILKSWETLRKNETKANEREKIIKQILERGQGKIADLSASHKASRVVQSCLKFGNAEQKKTIISELRPKLLYLSQNQYGHFLVKKVLSYSKEEVPHMLSAFRGHIVALLRHPCGAIVVDELYDHANKKQKGQIASEFYGPEVALLANLATDDLSLSNILEKATAAQKIGILTHIYTKLSPILDKGLVDAYVVHYIIHDFLQFAAAGAIQEASQHLAGPHLLHMVHTKYGSTSSVKVTYASNTKNRKKIVRALKGNVLKCANEEYGHIFLLALLGAVDDTILVNKIIIKEIASSLKEICLNKYGRRIILHLLAPNSNEYVPPNIKKILEPDARIIEASALVVPSVDYDSDEETPRAKDADHSEVSEAKKSICKKPIEVKFNELLFGSSKLLSALVALCSKNVVEMICSPHGSLIVVELVLLLESGIFKEKLDEEEQFALQKSILEMTSTACEGKSVQGTVLEHFYASRIIPKLITKCASLEKSKFVETFSKQIIKPHYKKLMGTHAEKILRVFCNIDEKALPSDVKKALDKPPAKK